MALNNRHGRDMTQGPIGSTLLFFTIPALASNIIQTMNGSINAMWVGHFLGAQALAATANAHVIMFLLFSIVFGFGMAATVLIAQAIGRHDVDAARRTLGSSVGFCSVLGLLVAVLGWIGAPAMLRALATPDESFDLALIYLRVIFASMPASLLNVMIMTGQRGTGDSRTPLIFMIVNVALDLILNPVLILGLGPIPAMGIAGSAVATAAAGFISLFGLIFYIYAKDMPLRLRGKELRYLWPSSEQLRIVFGKGLPMGMQMIVMSFSGLLMIGLVNREGVLVTAAYSAAQQIWTYLQVPTLTISAAVSAMAAQNIGAGRWDRIGRITTVALLFMAVTTGTLVAATLLFHAPLHALFLGDNAAAIGAAWQMQLLSSWSFLMFGGTMILFGVMRANGAVIAPLMIMLATLIFVRLGVYYIAYPYFGADSLWIGFSVGSCSSFLLAAILYRWGRWRDRPLMAISRGQQLGGMVGLTPSPAKIS